MPEAVGNNSTPSPVARQRCTLPAAHPVDGSGCYASSRDIAAYFDVPHAAIIAAIDSILTAAPQYRSRPDSGNFRPVGDETLVNSPGFLLVAAALPFPVSIEDRLAWMDAFAAAKVMHDASHTRVHVHAREELPTLNRPEDVDASRMPVVFAKEGEVFATSHDVAQFFQKEHTNVLRDIDNLMKNNNIQNWRRMFTEIAEPRPADNPGRPMRKFEMNRDGFTLLAMGFTGGKALGFKMRYIEAFNAMESELRRRPSADPADLLNDPASLRSLLAGYADKVIALQGQVGDLTPKAAALDRLSQIEEGAVNPTTAAKVLGVGPKRLFSYMRQNRWIYRRPGGRNLAYQTRIEAGLLEMKIVTLRAEDGTVRILEQVLVTPKGLTTLAQQFHAPLGATQ